MKKLAAKKVAMATVTALMLGGLATQASAGTTTTQAPTQAPDTAPIQAPSIAPPPAKHGAMEGAPAARAPADPATAPAPADVGSVVFGSPLFDDEGEKVGIVDRPALTTRGGEDVVAKVGGFLGLGEREVLLTRDLLTPMEGEPGYRVALSEDQIDDLPEYEEKTPG